MKIKYGYMCKTDFNYELGEAYPYTEIYPSIEALKKDRQCVTQCGIVKVKITLEKVEEVGYGFSKT